MLRLVLFLAFASAPYTLFQSHADYSYAALGSQKVSMRVHMLNLGDKAASCTVTVGGQKKVIGVSVKEEAVVWFDSVNKESAYTVACRAN